MAGALAPIWRVIAESGGAPSIGQALIGAAASVIVGLFTLLAVLLQRRGREPLPPAPAPSPDMSFRDCVQRNAVLELFLWKRGYDTEKIVDGNEDDATATRAAT